ncbi:hypothetical protein Q1695_009483 [Nippostrongylus brasiliensis]|nr:hypothetical protein Q1695_009483 [Nippostrongylus brasiliensis]
MIGILLESSSVTTGLLAASVMRVFYIIKALQISVATIVIYRLLSTGELCDVRPIHSTNECKVVVRIYMPEKIAQDNADQTNSNETQQRRVEAVSGPIQFIVLTHRDLSLEEVHERNKKAEQTEGGAPSTEPQQISSDSSSIKQSSESQQSTEKIHTSRIPSTKGQETTKTTAKTTAKPEETSPTTRKPSTISAKTVSSVLSSPSSERTSNSPASTEGKVNEASTENTAESQNETKKPLESEENSEETAANNTSETGLESSNKEMANAEKPPSDNPVEGKIKLRNTIHNCVPLHVVQMFGFGSADLSHTVALRLPIACMILSIFGVTVSIVHAFTNLSRPRRFRSFVENVAQVVLWALCAISLFFTRQEWTSKWAQATADSFTPLFPTAWHCAELLCYMMVIVYLVECYFYDYTYYKVYFEETLGNYTVVDRPEYSNSIYTSTVEMTEDTGL